MKNREKLTPVRKISDFKNYQEILVAIKEDNCALLVTILAEMNNWEDILGADDEAGTSLRELILSSSIDVNKPYRYQPSQITGYWNAKFPLDEYILHKEQGYALLTPMRYFFANFSGNPLSQKEFNEVQIILALGFEPNLALNEKGDTALHFCIQRKEYFLLLKYFITACADINKENREGLSVLNLVNEHAANYLKNLALIHDERYQAALKIQHHFRVWKARTNTSEQHAVKLEYKLLPKSPKKPKSNPPNQEKLQL